MAAATVLSLFMIGFYEVRADDPVKGRIPALPPFQLALVDNPPPPQSIPTAPISPIPALITKPVVTQIPPPDPLAWTQAGADSNAPQRHSRRIAAGFLHASGTQIVDSLGESVLLKGVNTGAWLLRDPFWYDGGIALEGSWDQGADDQNLLIENGIKSVLQGDVEAKYRQIQTLFRNNFITKPDIDDLSRFGFNCVRVPIDYRLFSRKDDLGHIIADPSAANFTYLDSLIDWCWDQHLYVIIDMHVAPRGFCDDQSSFHEFLQIWQMIALRYKNNPVVGGYDLINEPNWSHGGWNLDPREKGSNAGVSYLTQTTINAIREVDSNHMIIVEGFMCGDVLDNFFYDPTLGKCTSRIQIVDSRNNLCLSVHRYPRLYPDEYDPKKDHGPDASNMWWSGKEMFALQHQKKLASMANCPLIVGEFGNNQNNFFRAMLDGIEGSAGPGNFNISGSWTFWTYKTGGWVVISHVPTTPEIEKMNPYFKALGEWVSKGKKGPAPKKNFSGDEAFEWLTNAAIKTNHKYCLNDFSLIDTLIDGKHQKPYPRQGPYTDDEAIPGKLLLVNYDLGGEGVAYHSSNSSNSSWNYREDGVSITPTADGLYSIGGVRNGEWVKYTLKCAPGEYQVKLTYATPNIGNISLKVENLGFIIDHANIPPTGSFNLYRTTLLGKVSISISGQNTLTLCFNTNDIDCQYLEFNSISK